MSAKQTDMVSILHLATIVLWKHDSLQITGVTDLMVVRPTTQLPIEVDINMKIVVIGPMRFKTSPETAGRL